MTPCEQRQHREQPEERVGKDFLAEPDDFGREGDEESGTEGDTRRRDAPQPETAREDCTRRDEDHEHLQPFLRLETREETGGDYQRENRRILGVERKRGIPDVAIVVSLDERSRERDVRCVVAPGKRRLLKRQRRKNEMYEGKSERPDPFTGD